MSGVTGETAAPVVDARLDQAAVAAPAGWRAWTTACAENQARDGEWSTALVERRLRSLAMLVSGLALKSG